MIKISLDQLRHTYGSYLDQCTHFVLWPNGGVVPAKTLAAALYFVDHPPCHESIAARYWPTGVVTRTSFTAAAA